MHTIPCPGTPHIMLGPLNIDKLLLHARRPGYASVFTLHCSLQAASGKMFVHAREADSPSNMRYMGLLVDKYVPDLARCRSSAWTGETASASGLMEASHACSPDVHGWHRHARSAAMQGW